MGTDINFVKECVEKYRSKLLDTSRRNSLISFNHSERSRQHIRIIDELPNFLYGEFLDGKKLTFLSLPEEDQISPDEKTPEFIRHLEQAKLTDEEYTEAIDAIDEDEEGALDKLKEIERNLRNKIREDLKLPIWKEQKSLTNAEVAKKHDLNPSYEMPEATPENQEDAERHTDKFIQTLLKPEEMSRKLSGLNSYVRTDIEESGVNTLYVAFGFLEWYESSNSDKKCISPLLLLQLEIEKKQSREGYTYSVEATGEDPEINLSLSERLRSDFGIELPTFTGEDDPENYMRKVANLIEEAKIPKKEKWKIRRFITIGRFRFARLVMFHDLNATKWPGNSEVSTNKVLQSLFAGSENESGGDHAEDYDIDTVEVEETVPLLITSADASQHSALVDVMKGKNLAIKGPPGTGKSQTITNIIANALAEGKRVLFLAEKMAALNVVYERLSSANLGPYCLELHSTKAKKTEVLKSIEERINLRTECGNGNYLASRVQDFKRHRDHITEYIAAMNSNFGRQNKSVYDYLWGAQLRKDRIGDLLSSIGQCKIPFEQADLTVSELSGYTDGLERIASLKKQIETDSVKGKHPWGFVGNAQLNPFQQDELKLILNKWKDGLEKIEIDRKAFNKNFNLTIGDSVQDINAFDHDLNELIKIDVGQLDTGLIADLGDKKTAVALASFVEQIHVYQTAQKEIQSLQNVSVAVDTIKEIEQQVLSAQNNKADHMTALDLRAQVKDLEEELKLWDRNLKTLLSIGERFGVSNNEDLDKIYVLAEVPDYISSVPRDYLLFRTSYIIDETNAPRLKTAAETQERIESSLENQEARYDLSMMGQPHEIRMHAAALRNAGFFAIFDSSYRQAKRLVTLASKHKSKFDAEKAASTLRSIADNKEEKEKIEQDGQLRAICGSLFNGIHTDFKKLQQINEWASNVRQRYASGDEFSRNVRQWLLKGDMEELDSVRELARDDCFIALKTKISQIKDNVSPDTPVKEYLDGLVEKIEKLNSLKEHLQSIASTEIITYANIADDLPRLQNAKEARDAADQDKAVKKFFGDFYNGADTDIDAIDETAQFIGSCLAISELEKGFDLFLDKQFAKTWKRFKAQLEALTDTVQKATDEAAEVDAQASIRFDSSSDENYWLNIKLSSLIEQLSQALKNPNSLNHWVELNGHYAKAVDGITGELLKIYDQEDLDFETLPTSFEYMVYSAVAREIYQRNPVISKTSGMSLEQARSRIKELNEEIQQLQQDELCNKLNGTRALPGNGRGRKSTWTEGALLHNEINKKRAHVPIRALMKRAGQSIQKLKPCFLMSPLTVAQYLEPGKFKFDLIVIDEASQMRPEDALGGVARADQIVVVGDPQQLPPTSFFQSAGKDDEVEEDFTSEAIMDMALSSFRPSRTLSRHYRSQHESLIAFSNYHFYDQSLVLFPSPVKNPDELGVKLEYVGGTYAANSNMDEVEAVVKAAVAFMRKHPDRSLGIATMNQVQKDLIEIEMDRAFHDHPHAANYRDKWQETLESFFVKNLESVQGDERDAIFISTVYGPDKNGTVMQRFGPINRAGGYRRLNVLFSRAKKNMVVFTSLNPEDIKINDTSSEGIRALRGFLAYASKGVIDEGQRDSEEIPDSDFEVWVKEKLESVGCEVHPQVGVAGYRIDLGVKHPKYPYGYLMGIECDGATYHSSKSARERDVIRQQVLEGLGWRIYRIWSTDWFSNPVQEFEKLKDYIQELLESDDLQKATDVDSIIEHDFISNEKDDEVEDLFDVAEKSENAGTNTIQVYDNVTYLMLKNAGKEEKRAVQIVPTQGDPSMGTIAKHSVIGRALLGACEGEEVECILPLGEVTLKIIKIEKHAV